MTLDHACRCEDNVTILWHITWHLIAANERNPRLFVHFFIVSNFEHVSRAIYPEQICEAFLVKTIAQEPRATAEVNNLGLFLWLKNLNYSLRQFEWIVETSGRLHNIVVCTVKVVVRLILLGIKRKNTEFVNFLFVFKTLVKV